MARPLASGRRALLGAVAALTAAPLALAAEAVPLADADADLVRVCHAFAEAEWRGWWRYVTASDHSSDALDWDEDWPALAWITSTPASTPAGWAAKALALSAWDREMYDDLVEAESDTRTALLAALLRDMVAPVRAEILARCTADYGPLPAGYTEDARWVGETRVVTHVPTPLLLPHVDAEMLIACEAFTRAEAEVAQLERTADDDVFGLAVETMHRAAERVSGLRPRTVGGLRAKAAVARVVLAADEPAAKAGTFGGKAQRHDVLAWSALSDLVEVA